MEPNGRLQRLAVGREHEIIDLATNQRGQTDALGVRLGRQVDKIQDRGSDIDGAHLGFDNPSRLYPTGTSNDQRDRHRRVINEYRVHLFSVIPQPLPMVGSDHHQCVGG